MKCRKTLFRRLGEEGGEEKEKSHENGCNEKFVQRCGCVCHGDQCNEKDICVCNENGCNDKYIERYVCVCVATWGVSWNTVRYMIGEVQYGGRVTDAYDMRILKSFTANWFTEALISPGFAFYEDYMLPNCRFVAEYTEFISNLPLEDPSEVFGLHLNADITHQMNTANRILSSILNVQPKQSEGEKTGESREVVVGNIAEDMIRKLPRDYNPCDVKEAFIKNGGMLPMNILLRQEIDRMQIILTIVRRTLTDLKMAIEGSIIMNEDLKATLDAMYDAR